jgi:uroporphyrinogen decarboxylase
MSTAPAAGPGGADRRAVTPAENLRRLLRGEDPLWIPFTLDVGAIGGLTGPVLRRLARETGAEDPAEYFDCDFRAFSLQARFPAEPREFHADPPPGAVYDEWGIGHWAGGAAATCEKLLSPLAGAETVAEVEGYPQPVLEETDLEPVRAFQRRGYPIFGYAGSLYEWSWWLRGMERFMMDLLIRPELAEAVLEKVAGYTRRLALASARAGIDVLCFYDDAGMQRGMQVSPQLWRRFIKPRWRAILADIRAEHPEARFFLHSCGDIREIVADIVEVGFDILHPVQPECMDLEEVLRSFGRRITVCATLSAQRLLPFGTPEEVRQEVLRLKGLLRQQQPDGRAAGRGGILCPSNRIQPETPWANVLAFVEEARAG